jgi:hypothetical protein
VVIPEGSDGKGWLDVWVQLQKLTAYHTEQQAGGTAAGRKTDTAPKVISLRREGQSYAAVLGGQMPAEVGVLAEGRGNRVIRTETEKEVSLLKASDHAEERGVTFSNRSIVSIMGNDLKHNIDEAKNLEELKSFLRQFKEEAERWLSLLELGSGNAKMDSGGLEEGGQGNKAHVEQLKLKDPMTTYKSEGEPTCVYSRRSPRKVTTQWQQVTRQPLSPTPQPDMAVLTEQAVLSPGGGKDGLAGRVLLAGSCSTGLPKMCTKT